MAQMNTVTGDFGPTVERVAAVDGAFARQGADLAVYPSTLLTGHDPGFLLSSEGFAADLAATLDRLAEACTVPSLVPFVFPVGPAAVPEVAYINDGRAIPLRAAAALARLEAGMAPVTDAAVRFELDGVDMAVVFDDAGLADFVEGGESADVVVFVPFDGYNTDDESTAMAASVADGYYLDDAASANAWIVAVDSVGAFDEMVHVGGSFVLAPWGELACAAPLLEEAFVVADVDALSEGPLDEPQVPEGYHRLRLLWGALACALRDHVEKTGATGVTVLLTGDLMSAALAALAVDALGPTRVDALVVPGAGASLEGAARTVAANLRVATLGLDEASFTAAAGSLGASTTAERCALARVAARRLSAEGRLQLTSVDKTALALGQDPDSFHGAAFAPFSDVYRTDLCALVSERNLQSPVVPRALMGAIDVPEGLVAPRRLRPASRTLSDIDSVLLRLVERAEPPAAVAAEGTPEGEALAVFNALVGSEALRRGCPMGPVVSERSLREAAMAVGVRWLDRERPDGGLPLSGSGAADPDADDLAAFFRAVTGQEPDEPAAAEVRSPGDVRDFLRDFASNGGLSTDGDDIWGSGLFSKN